MRILAMTLLNALGATPEAAPPDGGWFVRPKIVVQIKAFPSNPIDRKFHFVLVTRRRFLSIDIGREVRRRNFGLTYCHVTHLWSSKADAIANCVYSSWTRNAHCGVDVYTAFIICYPHARRG